MHPLQQGYDYLLDQLKEKLLEITEIKKTLNQLAKSMGIELPFVDVSPEELKSSGVSVRIDEFVNKQPSTALQEYLNKSGESTGAVVWEQIVDILKKGGFDFSKFGGEKAVRMTLIKNTTAFKFIRKQNAFGLKSWYGNDQKPKKKELKGSTEPIKTEVKKKRGRQPKSVILNEEEKPDTGTV